MSKIAVLGAGSWGTALALQLARNHHDVRLWGHHAEHLRQLQEQRRNERYLPGVDFPDNLQAMVDLGAALEAVECVLIVVPSRAFVDVLQQLKAYLPAHTPVMSAIKGFQSGTGALLSDVFAQEFGKNHPYGLLAGPSFAKEVARNMPTAVTIAASDDALCKRLAAYFHGSNFLTYFSNDLIGAQIGGGAKNIIAIACGISDGLGFGANARAALITRGLREMMRLGLALKAERDTLMGLSGLGDLVLTCTDDQSRNRRFGLYLGRGQSMEQSLEHIGQTVEGIAAARDVHCMAQKLDVRMPIAEHVNALLSGEMDLRGIAESLLARIPKIEAN